MMTNKPSIDTYPKEWDDPKTLLANGIQRCKECFGTGWRRVHSREHAVFLRLRHPGRAGAEFRRDLLGVVRLHADSNYQTAAYAVLVRSDLKGRGIGWKLMELIIRYARSEKLKFIEGQVLQENKTMLDMCGELGFLIADDSNDRTLKVVRLQLFASAKARDRNEG